MLHRAQFTNAEESPPRRLCVYNSGFLTQTRIKRMLSLAGWQVAIGTPSEGDWVGVWGNAPSARRGVTIAGGRNAPVLRVEDAFLRSLHPGRVEREPPTGLLLDQTGLHFDASNPSDLETLLQNDPLDNTALLNEARDLIARMTRARFSKYSAYDPDLALPEPGYVLVIDQAEGDASVTASVPGGNSARARFAEMLYYAQTEHPQARVLIRTHPETSAGKRSGHFDRHQAQGRIAFVEGAHAPVDLLEGAIAVYTMSSQMGFEAILAGHKPRVFGTPFYAGWGLTQDEHGFTRRQRKLTRAQLFAGAMMRFPVWYDPFDDRLCDLNRVMDVLEATQKAWLDDRLGWRGENIRMWKRPHMRKMFGTAKSMRFGGSQEGCRTMVWGMAPTSAKSACRVEDGFLRSRGLGAELIPPLSLALDHLGMYYDPTRPSRLETLICDSDQLPQPALDRAARLMDRIVREGVTKYGSGITPPVKIGDQKRPCILVPGQVEDDASVLLGSPEIKTNVCLLDRVRQSNPDACIVYKPHPDVVAGLRPGAVPNANQWADHVVADIPITAVFPLVNAVWTLTSLTGFEALLRDIPVTTLGVPFYAGWGLTTDLCMVPERRGRLVRLEGLVHAALIDYPRYHDPRTGLPCPVEVALDRLVSGDLPRSPKLKLLAKAQGLLSSYSGLWRG